MSYKIIEINTKNPTWKIKLNLTDLNGDFIKSKVETKFYKSYILLDSDEYSFL